MRPVAIFRHFFNEGAGYFADFLDKRHIPYQIFAIDAGDSLPINATDFSGLVFMGGPMSVNDDIDWIQAEIRLIQAAIQADIPVLGHCLGGQLLAKALGGRVQANPVKEFGWGSVTLQAESSAAEWFGKQTEFDAFHWHGETFTLPEGAEKLLSSAYCTQQAFVYQNKHLGLQCHIEMTLDMLAAWCETGAQELFTYQGFPSVQNAATIQAESLDKLPRLNQIAEHAYTRWIIALNSTER